MNQVACLNLVTNAVIAWNTTYMAAVLEQLRAEGHSFTDTDVAYPSPARYEHVNPYGKYRFEPARYRKAFHCGRCARPDHRRQPGPSPAAGASREPRCGPDRAQRGGLRHPVPIELELGLANGEIGG